ncbi:MAG TPA: CPBP family intramembrane glutamic endopeptidase [Thermoanaerobaculia bacterium]|nr:CPBP family intramembrane glutamic endopeptidase [Thermoanaerobaculia bacterium]
MTGVFALTILVLPKLLALMPELTGREAPPVPIWALSVASLVQSAVLLAITVWLGTALAAAVGLRAPVFEAISARRFHFALLREQLLPALVGGVFGGALLVVFATFPPPELKAAQNLVDVPLFVRVLYGGVTEEILLRWGVMTLLLWLMWRFWAGRPAAPRTAHVWIAIVVSAVLFALGHLPTASLLIQDLTRTVIIWIVVANTLFGLVAGYLYWRYGLEAAMMAHAIAHIVGFVIVGR